MKTMRQALPLANRGQRVGISALFAASVPSDFDLDFLFSVSPCLCDSKLPFLRLRASAVKISPPEDY
jgi:hypothetical protein